MIILTNQLNYQLNIVILKTFAYCEMFCKIFFFSSQIYLKAIFYIAKGFLYQLKFLIQSVLLLEWNKTCCIDFFWSRFCQIIKHQSRRVYYFSQSCKISVFIDDREWILVLLSRMIINHSVATNIQLRKFRFKEGLELG